MAPLDTFGSLNMDLIFLKRGLDDFLHVYRKINKKQDTHDGVYFSNPSKELLFVRTDVLVL